MPRVNDKLIEPDQPALLCAHETRCQLVGADKRTFNVCGPSARVVAGRASADADVSFLRTPARSDDQRHPQFIADLLQCKGHKRQAAFIQHLHWVPFERGGFLWFDKLREGKIARQHLADARRGEARLCYAVVICVGHSFNSFKNGQRSARAFSPALQCVTAKPAGGMQSREAPERSGGAATSGLTVWGRHSPLLNKRGDNPGDDYAWATAQAGSVPLWGRVQNRTTGILRWVNLCIVLATVGRALVTICTSDTASAGRAY